MTTAALPTLPAPLFAPAQPHSRTAAEELAKALRKSSVEIDLASQGLLLRQREEWTTLKSHLLQYHNVERLDLRDCTVDDDAVHALCEASEGGGLSQLRQLGLRHTSVSSEELPTLLQHLHKHAPRLTSIDLSHNELGNEVATDLQKWLPAKGLAELDLSFNRFSDVGVYKVLKALFDIHAGAGEDTVPLRQLDLSDNRLGIKSTALLLEFFSTGGAHALRELRLNHCALDDISAPFVVEALTQPSLVLEVLDLGRNNCGLALTKPLDPSQPVALPSTLRVIDLSFNRFRPELTLALGRCLQPCENSLQELYLSHSLSGDEAVTTVLSYLRHLPQLKTLNVMACGLTYRCGKRLSQQLVLYAALERLYLSHNLLEVEGVTDFACGLERMRHLTALHLGSCHMGNCGAVAVVSGLLRSTSPMLELDLSDNGINDAGVREVCNLFARLTSPRLDLLDLSNNTFTASAQQQLQMMMNERQRNCLVLAHGTPLEEVASQSASRRGSSDAGSDQSSETE